MEAISKTSLKYLSLDKVNYYTPKIALVFYDYLLKCRHQEEYLI